MNGTYDANPIRYLEELADMLVSACVLVLITLAAICACCVAALVIGKYVKLLQGRLRVAAGRYTPDGVVFGRIGRFVRPMLMCYSKHSDEGHIIALGGSGLGKTSALLIPTLRSWGSVSRTSSFTIDVSGDIEKNVEMHDKVIFAPEDRGTVPYNAFSAIDSLESTDDKNQALEKLSYQMLPELPLQEASANARFYNDEGRKILTASLIAFYHEGLDFIPICEKIMSSSYQSLFNESDKTKNEAAIRLINSFDGASEQNTAGCKQSADAAVRLFATNSYVKNAFRRPKDGEDSVDPEAVETRNVFFVISDAHLDIYAQCLHLVVSQVLDFFSDRSNDADHNILLCLDELASFGKLELIGALRKLRKKKIRIFCLTQSLQDLYLVYGRDETKAMMNNFSFKVILGASDTDTQVYLSKLIGRKGGRKNAALRYLSKDRNNIVNVSEYAVRPEDLDRLGNSLVLLYPGGHIKLRKNYFYK